MKKKIFFINLLSALLTGCVTVQIVQPTPQPPTPTLKMQPTSQPPIVVPQPSFTPIPPVTSIPTQAGASEVLIHLIAIGDNGASGKKIGCGDSLVAVKVQITPTVGVLRSALTMLFDLRGQNYYGQSGLYNALYQSNLSIESLEIVNREAIIRLKGSLVPGGVCDNPRIKAQLEESALQFNTVDKATIFINGLPLDQLLSGQG